MVGLEDAKFLAALPGGLASCTGSGGGGGAPAAAMRAQLPHKNKRRVEGRLQAAPRLAWPSHSSKAGSQGDTGCATRPLTTLRAPPPPPTAPAAVPAAASRARQQPSARCSALLLFWVYIRMPGRSGRPLGFKGKDASFLFCHAGGPATCTSGGAARHASAATGNQKTRAWRGRCSGACRLLCAWFEPRTTQDCATVPLTILRAPPPPPLTCARPTPCRGNHRHAPAAGRHAAVQN